MMKKKETTEDVERSTTYITELPMCIMEIIVSLLYMRDAVNLVLAYRHWRQLSVSILTRRNLQLRQFDWEDRKLVTVRRFDAYLKLYQGDKVDSLKLDAYVDVDSWQFKTKEWISWAITKGIEELHIRKSQYRYFTLCTGFVDGFRRITILSLYETTVDQSLLANLSSTFLVLKSLTLNDCCIIGTSSLTRIVGGDRLMELKVLNCDIPLLYVRCNTEISAVNLASLEYIPGWNAGSISITTPRLARLFFNYFRYSGDALSPLIQFASCVALQILHLQMEAKDIPQIISLPTFENLKQMRLDFNNVDVNCAVVLNFLKAAPLLEEIEVMVYGFNVPACNLSDMRTLFGFTSSDHLKKAKMRGFQGKWYEIELAICILEISPKLKMLVLDHDLELYWGNGMFSRHEIC